MRILAAEKKEEKVEGANDIKSNTKGSADATGALFLNNENNVFIADTQPDTEFLYNNVITYLEKVVKFIEEVETLITTTPAANGSPLSSGWSTTIQPILADLNTIKNKITDKKDNLI